jgi:hypothetical protein
LEEPIVAEEWELEVRYYDPIVAEERELDVVRCDIPMVFVILRG